MISVGHFNMRMTMDFGKSEDGLLRWGWESNRGFGALPMGSEASPTWSSRFEGIEGQTE